MWENKGNRIMWSIYCNWGLDWKDNVINILLKVDIHATIPESPSMVGVPEYEYEQAYF